MKRGLALVCVAASLVAGCQWIGGIGTVDYDPSLDPAVTAGASGTSGAAGSATAGGAGAAGEGGAGGQSGQAGQAGASGSAGAAGAGKGGSAGGGSGGTSGQGGAGAAGGAGAGGTGGASGTAGAAGMAGTGGGGTGGGGAGGGGAGGCTYGSKGDASVRFGNLSPRLGAADFCVRTSGVATWEGPPLSRGLGPECIAGLAYREIEAPIALPSGDIDVKAIDGSAPDCSATALATATGIQIPTGGRVTILRTGGASGAPEQIVALTESSPVPGDARVRFVHTAPGAGAVDAGIGDSATWPVKLQVLSHPGATYGAAAPPGVGQLGAVDAHGYVSIAVPGGAPVMTVVATGSTQALAFGPLLVKLGGAYSSFLVGTPTDVAFPLELLLCNDGKTNGRLTDCGKPVDVAFEAFNTTLDGLFAGYEDVRRPAVLDALATTDADVICVGDLATDKDKAAFAAALAAKFPHSYWVAQNVQTQPDDPTDVDGLVPTPYATPPCAVSTAKLDAAIACLRDSCSSMPGSIKGHVDDSSCLGGACLPKVLPIALGTADDKRCYDCLIYNAESYTSLEDITTSCTTDPSAGMAFAGQSSQLLLSKYPIDTKRAAPITLPSTAWRITGLFTPILLPNGATVDSYCTLHTTADRSPTSQPYTGFYGKGAATNPWENEAHLQATRLLSAWKTRSGPTKSIVLGDLYLGPKYDGTAGGEAIKGVAVPTFDLLRGSLGLGVAAAWVPACTLCADNPLVAGAPGSSTWTTHLLLGGIPLTAVRETKRTHVEATVMLTPKTGAPFLAPPSPRYGLRSVIRIYP